jgi:hypothetical protein
VAPLVGTSKDISVWTLDECERKMAGGRDGIRRRGKRDLRRAQYGLRFGCRMGCLERVCREG